MSKDYDLNLAEENNYSIITNDELQDMASFTEYSSFVVTSSSKESPNNTFNRNNNQFTSYTNTVKMQPSINSLADNVYAQNGSSAGNAATQESFRQYMDQLTAYLFKNDPRSLQYLIENINKCKSGDIDGNDTGRTTPLLFPDIHSIARLEFPGLLYQLMPNSMNHSGGIITITDEIFPKHYDFQFDDYPGPLSIEKTTEEQIFYYLKDQISGEFQDSLPVDDDSEKLLLNYLELLIKENGKPRMSNIVRLLNDGLETKTAELQKDYKYYDSISRNSFSRASSRATSRASSRAPSPENKEIIDPDLPQNSLDTHRGPGSVSSVIRGAANNVGHDQKLYQNMDKFREYIWSGRFDEAVNFAMRSDIWDHAFALALRMNNTVLVNEILVRFSRRAIHGNDPLFTMHELMAARPPRIVATNRGFSHTEMNDWRSHLSMILAVKKFRPEESRQAIESMADKLVLLRCYFAAHLCYLLAETPFGIDKTAHKYRRKYDLIGWPSSTSNIPAQKSSYEYCHRLFTGLNYWHSAPEQCIKLTEIYEYVLKLKNDNSHQSLSVHLLPYKYLMAHKLLSQHHTRNAYEYCRNIGEILGYRDINWLECESVNFNIVSNIRNLSYKLHSRLTAEEDYSDPADSNTIWLDNIDYVYTLFCEKNKFWNPTTLKPDFFSEQLMYNVGDELDSVDDSGSQIKTEFNVAPTMVNSFGESLNSSIYPRQPQLQQYQQQQQQLQQHQQQELLQPHQQLQQQQQQQQQLLHQQTLQQSQQQHQQQLQQSQEMQHYSKSQQQQHPQIPPKQQQHQQHPQIPQQQLQQQHHPQIPPQQQQQQQHPQIPPQQHQQQQHPQIPPQQQQQYQHQTQPQQLLKQQPLQKDFRDTVNKTILQDHKHINVEKINYPKPYDSVSLNQNPINSVQPQQMVSHSNFSSASSAYQAINPYREPQESAAKNNVMRYPFSGNNFNDIPPPSELPTDAIMTSPPRRYDIKSTSVSNVDIPRDRQYSDNRNVRLQKNDHNPNSNFSVSQDPNYVTDNNQSQLPVLPLKNTGYNYPVMSNEQQIHCQNSDLINQDISQMQSMMFMPSGPNDIRGSMESVDVFANSAGYNRSRSQSNGSVGSVDSQMKSVSRHSVSRSRNSSESKENKLTVTGHGQSRPLETTKEETENLKHEKTKKEAVTSDDKRAPWNPLGWFGSKVKDVHLPDDSVKELEYDTDKKRWINKSETQIEKPPSPPPKLPALTAQLSFEQMSQFPDSASQNSLSKYRQVVPNVRAPLNIPAPSMHSVMSVNQGPSQYINQQYNDNRPYSTDNDFQYNNSNQLSYHNTNYQSDINSPYDQNIYQNSYQTMKNQ